MGVGQHFELVVDDGSIVHLVLGMKNERTSRSWRFSPRAQKATEVSHVWQRLQDIGDVGNDRYPLRKDTEWRQPKNKPAVLQVSELKG